MFPLQSDTKISLASTDLSSRANADRTERHFLRWDVGFDGNLESNGDLVTCGICDLSPGGARVNVGGASEYAIGSPVTLVLPDYGAINAEVRHVDNDMVGLAFRHAEADEFGLAKHLLMLKENDKLFDGRDKLAHPDETATGWLTAARQSFGSLAGTMPSIEEQADQTEKPSKQPVGGRSMERINMDELQARAQLPSQTLAKRQDRELNLWQSLRSRED